MITPLYSKYNKCPTWIPILIFKDAVQHHLTYIKFFDNLDGGKSYANQKKNYNSSNENT
jgi:hypothetical protein